MKKILLAAAAVLAVGSAPALAADLPAKVYTKAPAIVAPIYSWAGFYIGLNGGGGSSHKCWDLQGVANVFFGFSVAEGCHDATGGTVGGQIGYRWQAAGWVFGVEAQGNWADFKGSNASLFYGTALTNESKIDAFGLFTGQVGYAWNNVLWYVKGGGAVVDNRFRGILTGPGTVFDHGDDTRWGGTVGTGIEVGFAPNWSVAFEYDHLFMGNQNVDLNFVGPGGFSSRSDNIRQDVDIGTVRVNYRWGGPVIGKY